jgi:HEAT repeat protein
MPSVEFHARELMKAKSHAEAREHIEALGDMRTPEAVKALISALEHEDSGVAGYTAYKLGAIHSAEAVPALINALEHEKAEVPLNSAVALVNIGKEAVPALIKALKHENADVAGKSAWALGEIGGNEALVALMALADHPHEGVRSAVKQAIRRIQGAKRA